MEKIKKKYTHSRHEGKKRDVSMMNMDEEDESMHSLRIKWQRRV